MNLSTFYTEYNSEASAISLFRRIYRKRLKHCPNCSNKSLNWNPKLKGWRCSKCSKIISIKSISFMKDSNLKFLEWLEIIYLLTETKKTLSILEICRVSSLTRYKTVRYMVQKIRKAMGEINLCELFSRRSAFYFLKKSEGVKNEFPDFLTVFYGKRNGNIYDSIRLEIPAVVCRGYNQLVEEKLDRKSFREKKALLFEFKLYQNLRKREMKTIQVKEMKRKWQGKVRSNLIKELKGIFHSTKFLYLQNLLDEYSFKYNYRHAEKDKFMIFLELVDT